ncbi:MAG: sigma-70 family RNA polymerase sigma factor [Actinomycetota bacterium]|nr:sigma-70 family RNA polymerase sigma factor [Actinomycetota bacterium]
MTPTMRREFEAQWPALAARVERLLARKGIPFEKRDDLLQETAVRLIGMWHKVDPRRIEALATTIALNLLRDEIRRKKSSDIVAQVPEVAEPCDVEAAGLARVELARVRTAMASLSPRHRSVLLQEIGDAGVSGLSQNAEKMMRMRARKKLQAAMQKVSGLLIFRLRRLADSVNGVFFGGRDTLLQSLSCVGCVAIGLMVGVPDASLMRPAHAGPAPQLEITQRDHAGVVMRSDEGLHSSGSRSRAGVLASAAKKTAHNGAVVVDDRKDGSKETDLEEPIAGNHPKKKTPPSGNGLPVNPPDTGIDPSDAVPGAPDAPGVPSVPNPAPAPAPVPAPAPPGEGAPIDPIGTVEDLIDDRGEVIED